MNHYDIIDQNFKRETCIVLCKNTNYAFLAGVIITWERIMEKL